MSEDLERRIRQRAFEIWDREGRPEGRAQDHWTLAREEIAIEDNVGQTLKPNPSHGPQDTAERTEPVEPALSVANQGEMPGLDDQGNGTTNFPGTDDELPPPHFQEARPAPTDAAPAKRRRKAAG
ncbi:DUF2934 domain-containing protein [Azospirillum sp. ST 5-10]|uniref:DUF2934 domain-containing protein n=1 Tax=unclassified Azospirillum TaxID=2630922 RepID=UPI003F49B5D1